MTLKLLKTIGSFAVALAMAMVLAGCRGADGRDGVDGKDGSDGTQGPQGEPGTPAPGTVINAKALTKEQWGELRLKGEVTGVTMKTPGAVPVVRFKLLDENGTPVSGMTWTSQSSPTAYASYPNVSFSIAKLIPEDSPNGVLMAPSRWVNYIVTTPSNNTDTATWTPGRPSYDNIGALVDNGDGSYEYTFRRDISQVNAQLDAFTYNGTTQIKEDLDDVTYDPNVIHRMTVQVAGAYRGTGTGRTPNTENGQPSVYPAINILGPANLVYDFIPATGEKIAPNDPRGRELVTTAACNDCHGRLGHSFHEGARWDVRYCTMCHTDQRKYGYAESTLTNGAYTGATNKLNRNRAAGNMVILGHTLHMGEKLVNKGYNYAGVLFNEIGYPMDIKNCTQCHRTVHPSGETAAQGDNWYKKPSALACGACHEDGSLGYRTNRGQGHVYQTGSCQQCHNEDGASTYANWSPIKGAPVSAETQTAKIGRHLVRDKTRNNNANPPTSPTSPEIALHNFEYDLRSVTRNADGNLTIVFRIKQNGAAITNSGSFPAAASGFTGGPSFYIMYGRPQDGNPTPADFNYYGSVSLANILNGNQGTLSANPDADGFWTATTNDAATGAAIQAGAVMVTCYMTGGYVQAGDLPATFNTTAGGHIAKRVTPSKRVLVGGITGNAARRSIADVNKCNDCHDLYGSSLPLRAYGAHGSSQANDPSLCAACHQQRNGNGWSSNMVNLAHAIHAPGKRTDEYRRYPTSGALAGRPMGSAGYPGVLNNCEQCHLPGTYDFSNAQSQAALPNLLWTTAATGAPNANWPKTYGIDTTRNYGTGPATGTGAAVNGGLDNLVNSPITHACAGCHDSEAAIAHMRANGGYFYARRGDLSRDKDVTPDSPLPRTPFPKSEGCLFCHGSGKIADIKKVHSKF
ncbi:MAG: OmcA/MtrC family decaheme c-type cytochrome [Holophagales bacterium]|jgi:OmcA/MtrC family decaheme c-type cytochrome|nr:OmcA/MtrC family decaheme c-type cytochrome [Holophagales bacterium]